LDYSQRLNKARLEEGTTSKVYHGRYSLLPQFVFWNASQSRSSNFVRFGYNSAANGDGVPTG
jgi:hypothetical protein